MPVRSVIYEINRNPVRTFLISLVTALLSLFISLPLYIPVILVLPTISVIRWLLFKIYCSRSGHTSEPESMSGAEERWMGSERGSILHAVLILDKKEPLNLDQFRRILATRVLPLYPRLTRIPVALPLSAGAGFCWMADTKFSISRHVFYGPTEITNKKLVQIYIAKLMHKIIDSGKPPWEFHIILPSGRLKDTLIVARIHQSIGDGSELVRVLCHSLADTPIVDIRERPQFGKCLFGLNVLRAVLTGPCTLIAWLWLTTTDISPLSCNCNGKVTLKWSASVTLPKVMRIKQVTRSTVNCVILSALAGAVRVLLQGCGIGQPPNVKVKVPVDIRSKSIKKADSTWVGNKSTSMSFPLPVSVEGCVPRLWATRSTLSSLNSATDPVLLYLATAALMTVASAATGCFFLDLLTNKTTIQYSSVSGPTSYLSIGGGKLEELYCINPTISRVGISVTCVTYADQVLLSVVAENNLSRAAQLLLNQIEHQIEVLAKLLLHRRVPGENSNTVYPYVSGIVSSPMQKIEDRILEIQKEVALVNSREHEGEFNVLKMEYTQLVGELKNRLSESTLRTSHTRVRSGSLTSRLSTFSLKNVLTPRSSTQSLKADCPSPVANRNVEDGSIITADAMQNAQIQNNSDVYSHLIHEKHRKNSFEFMRFQNKRKEYTSLYQNGVINHSPVARSSEKRDSDSDDYDTDYCDDGIKLSDDEGISSVTGPINSTLRDLYCSNYLEDKLQKLKQQQNELAKQITDSKPSNNLACNSGNGHVGLPI